METYYLAQVSLKENIPFMAYKTISDFCQRKNKETFLKKLPRLRNILLNVYSKIENKE